MNEMYVVIRCNNNKEEVVDIRNTFDAAVAVCACYNTMRLEHDDRCFVKKFKRESFANTVDEQVNSVYKIKVSYKNLEIWNFMSLEYIFGEKDEIKCFDEKGRGGCVQLVRTYDYRIDPDKVKTEMYDDVCDYIKRQKEMFKILEKVE